MINGCVTSKSSSPSSPVSMMSPSSLHSSPQASSSFSQDRSPVSSPSRTTFQSVPLLKPSAIKDPSVHGFPPSTLPSMCFPLHAIYAQNPYSGLVGNNLSTFFSPHAIARQMSFLGNSFSQNISGKRIPAEDFSRFPPVFSPLNSGHRTNSAYPTAKQGCLFPFNSGHSSGAHPLHNTQNNMFNALNNECLTSPSPPFKRKMLNISGDSDLSTSTPNDSPAVQSTSIGSNNWCRSPSQPLSCPLCSISLEGVDIRSHFYEEVHKVETLRKLSDFAYHPNDSSESNERFESRCSSFQKKLPYSRWETFQRVKQNRHSRLTAMIRQTRKKFESEELRTESGGNPLIRGDIWNIGSDVSTTSQRIEDEDENDSSSEKNVDVVSDGNDNDKEADCEKLSEGSNSAIQQNRDSSETKAGNDVTDGEDVKPLENGLSPQQSNIQNNSDNNIENIEDIHETIYMLRKRIRELENKENDSANNETFRSLPSMV